MSRSLFASAYFSVHTERKTAMNKDDMRRENTERSFARIKSCEAMDNSYYIIPKLLFTDIRFTGLSANAILLYSILLDRVSYSQKSGWYDKSGNVYIIYTREKIKDMLGWGKNRVTKYYRQLTEYGLIEEKRQGLGKPNIIFVKKFTAEANGVTGGGIALPDILPSEDTETLRLQSLSYIKAGEEQNFSYFVLPKAFITSEYFAEISIDALLLYSILLDRVSLSNVNDWRDEDDNLYIYYSRNEIRELLSWGKDKTIKVTGELNRNGLISEVHQSNMPNKIYVNIVKTAAFSNNIPVTVGISRKSENRESGSRKTGSLEVGKQGVWKSENREFGGRKTGNLEVGKQGVWRSENRESGGRKTGSLEVSKQGVTKPDNIKPDNHPDITNLTDRHDDGLLVKDEDDLTVFLRSTGLYDLRANLVDAAYFSDERRRYNASVLKIIEAVIRDAFTTEKNMCRINGELLGIYDLQDKFLLLRHEHIEYTLNAVSNLEVQPNNMPAYIRTILVNSADMVPISERIEENQVRAAARDSGILAYR
jgi:hypothetical protein